MIANILQLTYVCILFEANYLIVTQLCAVKTIGSLDDASKWFESGSQEKSIKGIISNFALP